MWDCTSVDESDVWCSHPILSHPNTITLTHTWRTRQDLAAAWQPDVIATVVLFSFIWGWMAGGWNESKGNISGNKSLNENRKEQDEKKAVLSLCRGQMRVRRDRSTLTTLWMWGGLPHRCSLQGQPSEKRETEQSFCWSSAATATATLLQTHHGWEIYSELITGQEQTMNGWEPEYFTPWYEQLTHHLIL